MCPELSKPVDTTPRTLEGERVRLEPLTWEHLPEISEIAFEPTIWRWTSKRVDTPADLQDYFESALAAIKANTAIVWVTRSRANGRVAGATRLYEIDRTNRTMELGWTWLHPDFQRTGMNVEAKLLQLTHAFEEMNALRVAFKTHHANVKSQTAIAALGAKHEGVFRNHLISPDGTIRHSVWFSIIAEEWPEVRENLQSRLLRY